jgi:mono/diheme cytochrome c family protein
MNLQRTSTWLFAAMGGCFWALGVCADSRTDLPAGPGRDLVYGKCQTCHDPQYLKDSAGIPREEWDAAIDNMRQYGLRIPADQRARILDYLATYLGPNPLPATPASAPAATASVDGATLYNEQCTACHQSNGQGVAGQFPPLAGNRDLFLSDDFVAHVVLFGLEGPLDVNGQHFESMMPPFGHLSDAQIAAVIQYVQGAWGNAALRPKGAQAINADAIAGVRKKELKPAAVLAVRRSLK